MNSLDIQVGSGRVPWAVATTTADHTYLPEGWVLPGGRRTADNARARMVAANMDAMMRDARWSYARDRAHAEDQSGPK